MKLNNTKNISKQILRFFFKSSNPFQIYKDYSLKIQKTIYRKKFGIEEFMEFFSSLGILPGDTIFLQTSWLQFYNFNGSPLEIVDSIIEYIGENGNLVMPSHTDFNFETKIFDYQKTPTNSGIICEVFRRRKGVHRSIHYNSSVCAIGKDAEELASNHESSYTSWDKNSPYYKLYKIDAKNVAIGLGSYFTYATPIHCVDSLLQDKLPYYQKIFTEEFEYHWFDKSGKKGSQTVLHRGQGKIDLNRYSKFVQDVPHINSSISNLKGFSVNLKPLIDKGITLAKEGKFLYVSPKVTKSDISQLNN